MGPTGSGKTSLASQIDAQKFEIVSVDSRQVYKGLEISSAAPDTAERARIPHHLVSVILPDQGFDAAKFVTLAHQAIEEIIAKGKIPVLVGGSGFYYRALASGGPLFQQADPQIKAQLHSKSVLQRRELFRELLPHRLVGSNEQAQGEMLHPNDDYRITRALEIYLSEQKKELMPIQKPKIPIYDFCGWWIEPDLEVYLKGLADRIDKMIHNNMIDEIWGVYQSYGLCPGLSSLGCKDVLDYKKGLIGLDDLKLRILVSHRQYGKRQRTWFRKEKSLKPVSIDNLMKEFTKFMDDA